MLTRRSTLIGLTAAASPFAALSADDGQRVENALLALVF